MSAATSAISVLLFLVFLIHVVKITSTIGFILTLIGVFFAAMFIFGYATVIVSLLGYRLGY